MGPCISRARAQKRLDMFEHRVADRVSGGEGAGHRRNSGHQGAKAGSGLTVSLGFRV